VLAGRGAAPPRAPIAVGETAWRGVIAEVLSAQRSGNVLDLELRLRNTGSAPVSAEIRWAQVWATDPHTGRTYGPLSDASSAYVASLAPGSKDTWRATLRPGDAPVLTVRVTAPAPGVKTILLQAQDLLEVDDIPLADR
jgi:hypothetical protein